jgi:hypothetical protein
MRRCVSALGTLCLLAGPLAAQMQIGGGICSSASLSGTYSLTLTGRDVSSSATFTKISEGVGSATFDGQSKVTLSLTTNTNAAAGTPQTLSGTYSLQANCSGTLTITTGDTASFTLEAFNNPTESLSRNFLLAVQDGTYAFTGNGGLLPASCSAAQFAGVFAFNATSFALSSGAVSGVANITGLLTLDGKNGVSANWYVAATTTANDTATGQYSVAQGCTGSASVTDPAGNTFSLAFTLTSATGANFLLTGASPALMFTGSGRTL